MPDVINHIENTETGKAELWITIKDASDLLGISERHAWNIIIDNSFQRKKLLNHSRKKTYILRSDIEKFFKEEQERQRLEALKLSPLSEMSEISEKRGEFEMSEIEKSHLSERDKALSESQKALSEMSEREKQAIKAISEREIYIKDIERILPQEELDRLNAKRENNEAN